MSQHRDERNVISHYRDYRVLLNHRERTFEALWYQNRM